MGEISHVQRVVVALVHAGLDNYSTLQAEPWTHAEIPTPFQYRRGEIGGKVCPLTTKNYDTTFNRFWC